VSKIKIEKPYSKCGIFIWEGERNNTTNNINTKSMKRKITLSDMLSYLQKKYNTR
jgi:hypothetical protein